MHIYECMNFMYAISFNFNGLTQKLQWHLYSRISILTNLQSTLLKYCTMIAKHFIEDYKFK